MAPTDPMFTPPVVATMVGHEPGDWFAETLAALASLDCPGLRTLWVRNGTPDDPATQQARDLIATHVPGAVVRHTGANVGYAAACNAVLSLVEGEGGLFCFLHDDVALAPDAVSRMVEELHRSNAGVVGPKLVHWDDPRMIQGVGTAVDRLGVAMPLADDGEIDQEQHDSVQDVFVLSSACLLVRSDLFRRVGGLPTDTGAAGTDLDFCGRVHLQGARVVVVPAAVAMHRESMLERTEADTAEIEREQDESRITTVLTMTSLRRLPALVVEMILVTMVHALVVLVTGSPRRAFDEIRALLRLPFTVGT
ncbi:MAG: glycosyltransferase, partial [Actinomycetota bacterium]